MLDVSVLSFIFFIPLIVFWSFCMFHVVFILSKYKDGDIILQYVCLFVYYVLIKYERDLITVL